jgi:glycosyltransferase involved in cell wall biosynthesis
MNKIAVVILTWNKINILKNTLNLFKKYNPCIKDNQFIIVDNGSIDGTYEFLKTTNYDIIVNKENLGAQMGKYIGWNRALERGFDFILFLEHDHLCTKSIPIKEIMNYLNKNQDVGIVRLNDKKYYKNHHITDLPVEYFPKIKLVNDYKIFKCTYHFTSHPSIFRTSTVPFLKGCVYPEFKPRSKDIDISKLGFEKYKDIDLNKYIKAKKRCLYNWGLKEYEYMRLFLFKYQISAQLDPPCFHYVVMKRPKDWKN